VAEKTGFSGTTNYSQQDFVEATLNWTNGLGARLIVDTVGGVTFCKSFAATRLYGRVVTLLSTTCDIKFTNMARLRNLSIGYVQITAPLYFGLHAARVAQTRILERGAKLFEQGNSRCTSAWNCRWSKPPQPTD